MSLAAGSQDQSLQNQKHRRKLMICSLLQVLIITMHRILSKEPENQLPDIEDIEAILTSEDYKKWTKKLMAHIKITIHKKDVKAVKLYRDLSKIGPVRLNGKSPTQLTQGNCTDSNNSILYTT
jgi:hypothetical protein